MTSQLSTISIKSTSQQSSLQEQLIRWEKRSYTYLVLTATITKVNRNCMKIYTARRIIQFCLYVQVAVLPKKALVEIEAIAVTGEIKDV